ncbi:MAG: guanylate kinase [Phycisphaeraceae bacterium]|nr:guanylate kinase [Phycisphaeraceae bacterium]
MPPPAHRLPTDTDDGMVVIISGPSGVGKTTITRGIERSISDAVFSVSWTTRPSSGIDVEGVDYHFATDDEFEAMNAKGEFLETAGVYGKMYGTPKGWVFEQLKRGRLVILEIDVVGAVNVKKQIPDAFAIFVLPPNEESLLERLRGRRREEESAIQKRFAQAKAEIQQARICGVYDLFLVNEHLDDALGKAIKAIGVERERRRMTTR